MPRVLLLAALLIISSNADAEVFFSEYLEGSSNNKALELYNNDSNPFDLITNNCQIQRYANGSTSVSDSVSLSGTISANGTFVIANQGSSAAILALADQTGSLLFNGDDAVELNCNGTSIDIIGQIGMDPGSEWGIGDTSTANNTLRRSSAVCIGDNNGSNPFDPQIEWEGFAVDTIDGLGAHTVNCVVDVTPPTILSVTPSTTGPTPADSITFTVTFSEAVVDFEDNSDVTVNHTGTMSTGLSFNSVNSSTYQVLVSNISGTGSFNLTVNTNAVMDGAGNLNSDSLTSADVMIDPSIIISQPEGLLLSEIVVVPDSNEFIEIFNNSAATIDLENVYLTDATFSNGGVFYYQIVQGAGGGGGFSDFHARFPVGASIAAGEYQTISISGSTAFQSSYGQLPTYELYEDGTADSIPDMREAFNGSINAQGNLSDGEVAVLYFWDGQSDLVSDLDYALWGDGVEAVDKTGVSIDGPDGDAVASTYLPDTMSNQQAVIDSIVHDDQFSWQRSDFNEGNEILMGGNGLTGHNETSEGFRLSWGEGAITPNTSPGIDVVPPGPNVLINEINAVDSSDNEFVELFDGGIGNRTLSGLVVVFYNENDQVYAAADLDGVNTDSSGYALVGGSATNPDVILPSAMENGPAAVALYIGSASDFPTGQALNTDALIDAIVYDSGQADDAELLSLLEPGQPQVNEDSNANAAAESLQRCPNGAGGLRRTDAYVATSPTPGTLNNQCPLGDYYANVNPSNPVVLRSTLHSTIDDHQWFPYTSSNTDTWDILEMADEDPNNASQILSVYLNATYQKVGGGNSNYNREHTWPRSIGLGQTDTPLNNAATDAHNLRLANIGYNSDRGNKPFDTCDPMLNILCEERISIMNDGVGGGAGVYPGNSNWATVSIDGNTGSWEAWVDRRGDVARTMFYMDIRYEGGSHGITGFNEPDLVLTDNRSQIQVTAGGTAFMGLLSTLLEWHVQDPIDQKEILRNEIVFGFQGNRNPFVDHPEWVACLFQNQCQTLGEDIFSNGFENTVIPANSVRLH